MDLVNFRVGDKYIALNILDILVTERYLADLTAIPTEDRRLLGVKDYLDTPTPVFDLGLIMNNKTTKEGNDTLVEVLTKAEHDHESWLSSLENSLKNNVPFTGEKNCHKCNFGMWYDHFKVDDFDKELASLMKKFDKPHQRIHQLADELLSLKESGALDKALMQLSIERDSTVVALKRLIEDAKLHIADTYKPIIVYTTVDGRTPYIGLLVDSVEDSVNIDDKEIRSLKTVTDIGFKLNEQTRKMLRGIVKINNKHSLLIDSTAIFQPNDTTVAEPC